MRILGPASLLIAQTRDRSRQRPVMPHRTGEQPKALLRDRGAIIETARWPARSLVACSFLRLHLPKLREVMAQIDKVDGIVGQLSAEQRKVLAGMVNPLMPSLNQLFDKVLAIPGVSEVLKPTIDAVRTKLAVLTA